MMRHGASRGGQYDRIPEIDGIEGPLPPDSDVNGEKEDAAPPVMKNGGSSISSWTVVGARRQDHGNGNPRRVQKDSRSSINAAAGTTVSFAKKRKRWTVTLLLTGLFVAALVVMYRDVSRSFPMGIFPHGGNSKSPQQQPHTQPIQTLLWVVDPVTEQYLHALDNPLYAKLGVVQSELYRPTELHHHERIDDSMYPQLDVKPMVVEYGKPLTVSWTPTTAATGLHRNSDAATQMLDVTDDSILVLVCDPFPSEASTSGNDPVILEAATIAQAVATSRRHSTNPTDEAGSNNQWIIPSSPALRYESCRFQLYNAPWSVNVSSTTDSDDTIEPSAASSVGWWLIAESPAFQPVHRPTAIHLALTHDPTVVVVNFVTVSTSGTSAASMGRAAPIEVPIVVLVDEQDNELRVIEGTTTTYEASDLCQEPANETAPGQFQPPGSLHTVLLTDLTPNMLYRYRVGIKRNDGQGGAVESSEVYNFTTSLVRGDPQPFSYVVYGDQGCPADGWGTGSQWTAAMTAWEVDRARPADTNVPLPIRSVHHFGDLSYARGAAHIWDEWFNMIQVFSARVPLMIGVGNHEYDHTAGGDNGKDPSGVTSPHGFMPPWGNFGDDSGGECGVPTAKRFTMPSNNVSNGVFWYSHDYASVHTVVISSEHDLGIGSVQHEWLENDLASVDRAVTPWLVVETHRPLYEGEVAWDQNAVGIGMRREMEDLLHSYQVDLVLAGHYHAYHRTCDGLYKSRCNNGGPMHITVGSAGAHLDDAYIYPNGWTKRVILGEYGYGRITVHNASAMHFEFVKAGDVNDTTAGQVHDDVWIIRHR